MQWENLFKHIDIVPENVHILDGNAPDLEKECAEYEKKIEAVGGIELFLAGLHRSVPVRVCAWVACLYTCPHLHMSM